MRYIIVILTLSACLPCRGQDESEDYKSEDYESEDYKSEDYDQISLLKIEHYEGDLCDVDGSTGNCTSIADCQQALDNLKQNKRPKICGFEGTDPLVCCPIESLDAQPRITDLEDCKFKYGNKCEKTQRKSYEACVQYQEGCVSNSKIFGEFDDEEEVLVVYRGEMSMTGQFRYTALLGFGDARAKAEWKCGGTIISNNFILTAGHCTSDVRSSQRVPVTFALVGTLRRSDRIRSNRLFKVKNIFKHPDYNSPQKYNDIALLELERNIMFDKLVQPACLYSSSIPTGEEEEEAFIIGWGSLGYRREPADVLQYAIINKFPDEVCINLYGSNRLLPEGFNSTTQLCYGHHTKPKDACQGDSGGPLVSTSRSHIKCLVTVIGVTSFGKDCGRVAMPAVYTRVQHYLPWIESIVWP